MNSLLAGFILAVSFSYVIKWIMEPSPSLIPETLNKTYDYIIVGAGTAGCVLANRLSEDGDVTVLIIEAGHEETKYPMIKIPFMTAFQYRTEADWNYLSVPQKYSFYGINNKQSLWTRGKVLGGSSSLNFMLYVRGNKYDFDGWADEGAEGWNYDNVLPYFKKAENNQNTERRNSGDYGTDGPQVVSDVPYNSFENIWIEAGKELGLKHTDINGKSEPGVDILQLSVNKGERWHTGKSYLRPAMTRNNLHVSPNTMVTKILFDKNKQATGVEFIRNQRLQTITAKKEVILSAGALNSPQLLMLSGIGPKDHLKELGIPLLVNLPVGKNLQDHVMSYMLYVSKERINIPPIEAASKWNELQYALFGTGPLSAPMGATGHAIFHTRHPNGSKTYPDLQFMNLISTIGGDDTLLYKEFSGFNDETWKFLKHFSEGYGFFSVIGLLHPKSRGEIKLKSVNPYEYPIFDYQYLQHPDDIAILVDGMKRAAELAETDVFKKHGISLYNEVLPGCKKHLLFSDEYWECFVRYLTQTIYHYAGTCKMGAVADGTTVVDPQLRVKGVRNLRVIDASVMPFLTSGNTNSPTIMIAERGADIIKGKLKI